MDLRRFIAPLAVLGLLASLTIAPGARAQDAEPAHCGLTTLDGTINAATDPSVIEEGELLDCAPGEPIRVRDEFAEPVSGRQGRRVPLVSFFSIADVQLADEESPARGEWADECDEHPATSAFRPHETMVPHLLNAHARAANAIAEKGSPVLGTKMAFALALGDLADNNQFNEIRWVIDLFDGNKLVDHDSGDDGYVGVQQDDPVGAPGHPFELPESAADGERLVDLANEPFWAAGLNPKGRPLPWYSLPGNHDIKVQGTIHQASSSNTTEPWRAFVNAYAQGNLKLLDAPQEKQQFCDNPSQESFTGVLTGQGATVVPADEDRRLLERHEWIDEHFTTTGVPNGHGYGGARCSDEAGEPLYRACYAFNHGKNFRFIALDTAADQGLETGNLDHAQFEWLERELIAHSSSYYDENGEKQTNDEGEDRLIVVFSHHTISSSENPAIDPTAPNQPVYTGEEIKDLLLRFPNVIAQASGHTHQNKIWPHGADDDRDDTGYWEINNSAVVDIPSQSRTIEIADNRDGTLSIFGVVFDAAVPPNARDIHFEDHDHTHEIDLSGGEAERNINEDWLASVGREVSFYDPQQDLTKIGAPEDRNVELLLRAPSWLEHKGKGAGGQGSGNSGGQGGSGTQGGRGSGSADEGAGAVASPFETAGSGLALTGASLLLFVIIGLAFVVAGGGLTATRRR